jgi:bifunctional non-homologous end joining protein LigD
VTTREAAPPLVLDVDGRTVAIPNADKVLFPAVGFTKRDLVAHHLAVAAALLPHLAGHAVTLARFPDGVDAPGWYQANCPSGAPEWIGIAEVAGARGQTLRYCRLESAAALAWAAGQAALELHPLLGAADGPEVARTLVLDLDPRPPAGLAACARVALRLRERLAAAGLAGYPKTSGGRGLHLHVPVAGRPGFDRTRAFARALAVALAREDPDRVTERMALAQRAGKVLVDWRQNAAGRSLIAPYSLRASNLPLVATPLRWEEVEEAAAGEEPARGLGPLRFGPGEVLDRLEAHGDLLAPALGPGAPLLP